MLLNLEAYKEEKFNFRCWIPVFLSIGILVSSKFQFSIFTLVISICLLLITSRNLISLGLILIIVGIITYQLRYNYVSAPILEEKNKYFSLTGKIELLTPLENGYRIIILPHKLNNLEAEKNPSKIRLTIKTNINNVKIGDIVKLGAILSPPMKPYINDSYDFSRDAYFKQIGAVGYGVTDLKIISKDNKSLKSKINNLRNAIQLRVNNAIGIYYGSITTALMLNEYSNIDKEVLKNLRKTGLAHILSVSGMHLSLVMAIFFYSSRFLINLFPSIALRIHVKKYAAFVALLGSLFYLLISGMEVAAVRSFIMTSLIISAILFDQVANPLRAIAFAATIILLITPENLFHPSFQMSFSAVLGLIACFEKFKFTPPESTILLKIFYYVSSIMIASLVAGLSTLPFALYHFGLSSNYSILANLLAVPITSFWLMPCVVASFLLYPLHLETISLKIMKYGIDLVIKISNFVANLPYSVKAMMKISDCNLLLMVTGFLLLCVMRTKLRLTGILFILVSVILYINQKTPDLFIDWEKNIVGIIDRKNDQIIFLGKQLSSFKKQLVMNQIGITKSVKLSQSNLENINCNSNICTYIKDQTTIKINKHLKLIELITQNNKNYIITPTSKAELIRFQDYIRD